jgi:hypothetical protein
MLYFIILLIPFVLVPIISYYVLKWTLNEGDQGKVIQVVSTISLIVFNIVMIFLVGWQAKTANRMLEEAIQSRLVQEQSNKKALQLSLESIQKSQEMIEEMKFAREQQLMPYITSCYYSISNLRRYAIVIKNLGGGVAKNINCKYKYGNGKSSNISYKILGAGEETVNSGPHYDTISSKNVEVTFYYEDIFGNPYEYVEEQHMDKSLPTEFAKNREEMEASFRQSEIKSYINIFFRQMDSLNKTLQEIKDKLNED